MKRHLVQIPSEQVRKLKEIDAIRTDLVNYPISKKVHILLQEKLADIFKSKAFTLHKNIIKEDWFEYIRELIPTYIIATVALGVVRNSKEMIGCPFTRILVASENDKLWWGNSKKDIYAIGDYLIPRLMGKNFSKVYYKKYKDFYFEVKKLCEDIKNKNLSRLSNKKLLEEFNFFYEKFKRYHGLSFDIDAIDIVLEEKIREKFMQLIKSKHKEFKQSEFNSYYSLLTTPSELSYVNKEQLIIYEISKEIKNNKKLSNLFNYDADIILGKIEKNYPNLNKKLMGLVKEYWWTSLGWTIRTEKDIKSFIEDIKNILKENPNVEKELSRLRGFVKKIKNQKKQLAEELNFDKEILLFLDIFENYFVLHDYRKEIQMKGVAAMNKFLFEIGRRHGGKYEDLVWCWPSEIIEYMKTRIIDFELGRKRKEALFFLVTQDNVEECFGEEAIKRRNEELAPNVKNIHDFKGLTASFGKVTGKAKLCYSATDAVKKIQKGDILVASMTMPDYLPSMKKAAAIVTDEGGITSHAAIVSRELKIPCIVGTRIATRVLKDNDVIEVNANHGAVKILKN